MLLFDDGLSLVMLIEVGNIWCCSQISQVFDATNKLVSSTLMLPDKWDTFSLVLQPYE
jgi:hypothetical protein